MKKRRKASKIIIPLVIIIVVVAIVIFLLQNGEDSNGNIKNGETSTDNGNETGNGDAGNRDTDSTGDDNSEEKYFCVTNEDCVKYNTCSEECVNSDWRNENPYTGPECGAPWLTQCECVNNRCTGYPPLENSECTSDLDCEAPKQCWYKVPGGPLAGVPGTLEHPGMCALPSP